MINLLRCGICVSYEYIKNYKSLRFKIRRDIYFHHDIRIITYTYTISLIKI